MLVNGRYYGSTKYLKSPICLEFHELMLSNVNETNHLHVSSALINIEYHNFYRFSIIILYQKLKTRVLFSNAIE